MRTRNALGIVFGAGLLFALGFLVREAIDAPDEHYELILRDGAPLPEPEQESKPAWATPQPWETRITWSGARFR